MHILLFGLAFLAVASSAAASPDANADCDSGFTICSPPGATTTTTPQIGDSNFANLFVDIVDSSLPASLRRRSEPPAFPPLAIRGSSSLCCNAQTSCLTMANLGLPFCYDKFTTNYLLPDGSTGTVVGGAYTSAGGDTANLETGDYKLVNGTTGNIYASDPAAKPNTATLALPSQFTSSGVGSAIPLSSLGSEIIITYTTTLPGSTISASTLPPVTMAGSTSPETILLPTTTTISGASGSSSVAVGAVTSLSIVNVSPSTISGSTVVGSTVSPITTTVVTTMFSAMSGSATSTSTTSSKKSDARRVRVGAVLSGVWVGLLLLAFL